MQTKLIIAVLTLAFALAFTGQLEKATNFLKAAAIGSQKNDLIKLGAWNRKLNSHFKN